MVNRKQHGLPARCSAQDTQGNQHEEGQHETVPPTGKHGPQWVPRPGNRSVKAGPHAFPPPKETSMIQ